VAASSRFGRCKKKEILLRPFTLEDETTMLPQNAGIVIPSDTTSHTKTELWTQSYPPTVCGCGKGGGSTNGRDRRLTKIIFVSK